MSVSWLYCDSIKTLEKHGVDKGKGVDDARVCLLEILCRHLKHLHTPLCYNPQILSTINTYRPWHPWTSTLPGIYGYHGYKPSMVSMTVSDRRAHSSGRGVYQETTSERAALVYTSHIQLFIFRCTYIFYIKKSAYCIFCFFCFVLFLICELLFLCYWKNKFP